MGRKYYTGLSMNDNEKYWAGPEGSAYTDNNRGLIENNVRMFRRALAEVRHLSIGSVLELGANRGEAIEAMRFIFGRDREYHAIEINTYAADILDRIGYVHVHRQSVIDWEPRRTFDLVFTRGLLIHIPPEDLPIVYEKIYKAAGRYILLCEYYNPRLQMIPYHGKDGLLWKADYAGDMIEKYGLKLVDYGFVYHRDDYPQDDVSYFLLEVA